jgi:hypothetical protein
LKKRDERTFDFDAKIGLLSYDEEEVVDKLVTYKVLGQ